jgi:hypothetical protein
MITPDENGGAVFTGGLAGTFSGSVTDSVSTGNVAVGYVPWEPLIFAGGLLGEFSGAIRHSHATGHVAVSARNAQAYVGGLVGEAKGSISSSYATGDVEGGEMVGGLVTAVRYNFVDMAHGFDSSGFQAFGDVLDTEGDQNHASLQ